MQLRHVKTVASASDGLNKVTSICWSPNNLRLAVVTSNRTVMLYDENGEFKDKFPTKPADPKTGKNYLVRAMAFSPDSSKLAIAQTDNIVFVYKLGQKWGEKKTICNKYPQSTSITTLCWPNNHLNEIFFGLAEGKVKLGNIRTNKSSTVYATDEFVVSMCCSPDGTTLLAGHVDGSIYVFSVSSSGSVTKNKLMQHVSVPSCLSWGESIGVAGNDLKLYFYDTKGIVLQKFDYTHEDNEYEFNSAEFSPSGQSLVIGSFNKFRTYTFNGRKKVWEESGVHQVPNYLCFTSISWKKDGSRVATGSLAGAVDLYDACLRRLKYKGKFEMVYVSPSQVIVKRLSNGERLMLNSMHGLEITKLNVYKDRYLVAYTPSTILMGDLDHPSKLISEIQWQATGSEKFFFDNPGVGMVFNAGELTVVEYGSNEPIGFCRTEHVSSHLISVRINEKPDDGISEIQQQTKQEENKKIAFLVDLQTIHVMDLITHSVVATVAHDVKIDWLELNPKATKLLYRDNRRCLNMYNLETHNRVSLLTLCSYVQWVPGSDVVVAQSRSDLCVWYSIDKPERVSMYPIKGDVIDIERNNGKTEIVIDEGIQTAFLALNEPLIAFGAAIEERQFQKAVDILENLPLTPETEAMWATLSTYTLQDRQLPLAERCFAALGDMAKAKYLRKLNQIVRKVENEYKIVPGTSHYEVQAKLEILEQNFSRAEDIYLEQGRVEDAMEMYQMIHKWEDCIRVAEKRNHPDLQKFKANYFQWLLDTRQEESAAILKEKEEEYIEAINLYLRGGLPAKAATCFITFGLKGPTDLMEKIASSLYNSNLYEKAGYFFEKLNHTKKALESYKLGHAYRAAVELSRTHFPQQVTGLEADWGHWLVKNGQVDQAINHFIEAGDYPKAIESAIESKQWNKAVSIVENLEADTAKTYFKQIAVHYEESLNYEVAEKFYVKGNFPEDAVEMYTKANMWDSAHRIAVTYMSQKEITVLYMNQAQRLETKEKYKEAEKLYITINEQDLAITMYKKARKFDDVIRLVQTYHKDLVKDTHLHLAQQLEAEGEFKLAEKHYITGEDWKSAVNMYRANDMWEEAMRVAKQFGGSNASTQVAAVWARSLGGEAGVSLLVKFGYAESAVDMSIETGQWKRAEEICKNSLKKKLPDVYLKHAMQLEDEGNFAEAETEFIKGGSPKDAVDMYIHQKDWLNATRVAENFDPTSVYMVFEAQAHLALEEKNYSQAEKFFILARKPEEAVSMYKQLGQWNDVVRVTKEHLADKMDLEGLTGREPSEVQALIQNKEYSRAIDLLLKRQVSEKDSVEDCEESWHTAVKLALNHVPERQEEVVRSAARKLVDCNLFKQASEILENLDLHKEAIEALLQGELWDQARALASTKAPELLDQISDNKVQSLVDVGDWERALDLADRLGPGVLGKYLAKLSQSLFQEGKVLSALTLFVKWGTPAISENFVFYKNLTTHVLGLSATDPTDQEEALKMNKKMLYSLVQSLKDMGANPNYTSAFERLLMAVHYASMKEITKHQGLTALCAKLSTSLLRYCGEYIPADKAFYEAGIGCKESNSLGMAFVFLNRYLDVCEAMEEGHHVAFENADFERTDVPFDIPLPSSQFLPVDRREDARSWVLQASLDKAIPQSLNTRHCDNCEMEIYEACTICYNCKQEYEPCCVTGYPIQKDSKVLCTCCAKPANREDWNKFVGRMKVCPYCSQPQNVSY